CRTSGPRCVASEKRALDSWTRSRAPAPAVGSSPSSTPDPRTACSSNWSRSRRDRASHRLSRIRLTPGAKLYGGAFGARRSMSLEGAAVSLGATIVSLVFAALVFNQWISRRKPFQFAWSLGLGLYALASFTQFLAEAYGWTASTYKVYYLVAALLVAVLGIGALVIAGGASLARYGISWALYIGELVGIAIMFWGFLASQDLAKAKAPAAAHIPS